ncbi:MobF family relaxase [Mycolicibacterium mageritense]|uniref:MobF family relaxase n=1 Tax=Mycolicibacterium mageritense TaxID=53462 RepID=UPI0011D4923C|nr:MobF family relaxase [Mycolicibacterium mageritense]TXI56466.1 MAG: AAA family ATPase [Mycolicibacterium mageritense]
MMTIARLKRWGIAYYNRTAEDAVNQMKDRAKANGGLGDYFSENETRLPTWMVTGDKDRVSDLIGLSVEQLDGGMADMETVRRWSDDGVAPNGLVGRAFNDAADPVDEHGQPLRDEDGAVLQSRQSVHAFDLTIAAPKSVSLMRAMTDPTTEKIMGAAHRVAAQAAFDYIGKHAGYTRVFNPLTGKNDLERLPGVVGAAYQHETSREGDPHLHLHLIVFNRQARADGKLVTIDSKSLHHEAKAAGMIYQATLRRELAGYGFEWEHVGAHSGMAELAGVSKETIKKWSKRSTRLRQWAAAKLRVMEDTPTARQLAAAQRATRPDKPESLPWEVLKEQWRTDPRGFVLDREAWAHARDEREATEKAHRGIDRRRLADMAAHIPKAGFTRADMVELMAASWPVTGDGDVLAEVEAAVDEVSLRISDPRQAHRREGSERFTIDLVIAEEKMIFSMLDKADRRAEITVNDAELAGLGDDQATAIAEIGRSPQLVQVLQAPAGAGKTHSLKSLRRAAHRHGKSVYVLAPTGKAVDTAIHDQAGDQGFTVDKALGMLADHRLTFGPDALIVIDESSMIGTPDLHKLMSAATKANAKMLLVGDQYQLAPVLKRGGMFEQLSNDLPWTQRLEQVWRMRDPEEKDASLALRNGEADELKSAVDWYREHNRLAIGDPVAMAEDVYAAYLSDRQNGQDSIIIADTWEMTDSLNMRLHAALLGGEADRSHIPNGDISVKVSRDHRVSIGDIILTRNNDATIDCVLPDGRPADQVRNGNRWTVVGIDTERELLHAVRGGTDTEADRARATFTRDYAEEHITLGYATTVHSAQGVTADTCHSLIGSSATRTLAYVAMTRGRHTNDAYLYEKFRGELDHEHTSPTGTDEIHILKRGTPKHAAQAFYTLMLTNDDRPTTMHALAAKTAREHLPARVATLVTEHAQQVARRFERYQQWRRDRDRGRDAEQQRTTEHDRRRGRSLQRDDAGLEL